MERQSPENTGGRRGELGRISPDQNGGSPPVIWRTGAAVRTRPQTRRQQRGRRRPRENRRNLPMGRENARAPVRIREIHGAGLERARGLYQAKIGRYGEEYAGAFEVRRVVSGRAAFTSDARG